MRKAKPFELEPLEPRILLSADPAGLAADGFSGLTDDDDRGVENVQLGEDALHSQAVDGAIGGDAEDTANGLFAGLEVADLSVLADENSGDELLVSDDAAEDGLASESAISASDVGADHSPADGGAEESAALSLDEEFTFSDDTESHDLVDGSLLSATTTGSDGTSSLTDQLVETLHAANPPPTEQNPVISPENEDSGANSDTVTEGSEPADREGLPQITDEFVSVSTLDLDENEVLIIANGETLGGSGTINGSLINHGVLSPGNSPGILDIDGDLDLASPFPEMLTPPRELSELRLVARTPDRVIRRLMTALTRSMWLAMSPSAARSPST